MEEAVMIHGTAAAPPRPSVAPLQTWETEVFILRGEDRDDLCRRVQALQHVVQNKGNLVLKDLAYTLNAELGPGGSRLAVVAGSAADLQARLTTAAQRLTDPKRTQIKDAAGIYYFDQPLHPQGGLALLFPGEGAQYLNMLGDLCPHFPEVKKCFDDCDRLTDQKSEDGRRGFIRVFLVPEDAGPAEKAEAERALRELDNAMFSVLMADWAMFQLFVELGLKPAAMAGHSMGELAALWAAGCLENEALLLDHTAVAMKHLLHQETSGELAEAVLLAVGAGRDVVGKVIADKAGTGVYLAMDNCPHQSVVVGLADPMGAVEADLLARRILCERLPFNRPYHTPLFEPYLGPLQELFQAMPFRAARTPIYSCSTARPFPTEPEEIRRLSVWHYATPVEFTRLIENMYADGVRLFVESGPRGNLTSFTEDILRGKPFAAVAANLPRRSGLTQLNHLVGQLAAHHVPLNLEHFYRRRDPQRIPWECGARATAAAVEGTNHGQNGTLQEVFSVSATEYNPASLPAPGPVYSPTSLSGQVFHQYMQVMEQFLDTQREVMEAFFAQRQPGSAVEIPSPAVVDSTSPPPLPLLGEITHLEPGQEVIMRRRLDLAEDLFVLHHTVGGRSASKVDPDQHGLPVMPMTFSLEIMAEVASLLAPGLVVVGLKGIRLFRWLAFDEQEPTTIEVKARVLADAAAEPGAAVQVAVEIRDLGNAANSATARWIAGQATVLLGPNYPEPPPVGEFPLTNEHPARIPLDTLYKNLFHGPLFQGVSPGGRAGDEGIEKEIFVLPRNELFRSNPDPKFLLDPVLLDVAMHPLAAWHLEDPDQSGRILLPIELEKLEMFGPPPEVDTRLSSRGLTLSSTPRNFVHQVDVIGPGQKTWCRFNKVKYWRFYVPFGKVNFHGPKDEYFISKEWKAALPQTAVPACCIRLDMPLDQKQAAMRLVTAKVTLSPAEWQHFRSLSANEQKQNEWLFGRIAAKDAVRILWHSRHGNRMFPADIIVETDEHGRPIAVPRGPTVAEPFPSISIAHSDDVAAGLAAFGPHAGIDVEKVRPREPGFEGLALDADERSLLDRIGGDRDDWITRFWCAKEAVAKALGRGLVDGPKALAIRGAFPETGVVKVVLGPALAAVCPEWQDAVLIAHTVRDGELVVASTFCEKDEA